MANSSQTRVSRRDAKNTSAVKAPKNSKKPKQKKTVKSIILRVVAGLFLLGCLAFLAGVGLFWWYAKEAPSLDESQLDSTISSKFYAANGEMFQDIGSENRQKITATEIPKQLEDAIVSVEDRRFYKHVGVDPIRIVGSALSNFTSGGMQGGSTLTQQLIKLSFFSTSTEDQNLRRKAQEAWMAVKLEQEKSKQEILTYYINKVYMSNGVYGMKTAAEKFYGKPLDQLTLAQTALIAGVPNAPSAYDPYAHPDKAKERRDIVLYAMYDNDKISSQEYEEAKASPVEDGLITADPEENSWKYYDNYIKEVIDQVEEATGKDVYTDGLSVYTNLDLEAQKKLYDIVNSDEYVEYPDEEMQVAATLMDVDTGKVTAQIGGRNVDSNVVLGQNLAVNTARDFGSTVKPVTDYGPAFQYLQNSTGRVIADEPYTYAGTNIPIYNWDRQYMGQITLRTALYESRNVPAAKLFQEVGADKVNEFLKGLGIEYKTISQSNAISSNTDTLDGEKYGVSSLKMAAAYAAFANGGTYFKPQYVSKVVYQDGSEDEESFIDAGKKAMDEATAYMVTDVLKDVISIGTGTNAQIPGLYQAGKTGTSNYTDEELAKINTSSSVYPDISFAGYTPAYSLAVWTGYNDKLQPVTDSSTHVATDVYRELMQYVSSSVKNQDWKMPDTLTRAANNELYLKGAKQSVPATSQSTLSPSEPSTSYSDAVPSSESSATSETTSSSTTSSSQIVEPDTSSQTSEPAQVPSESSVTPTPTPTPTPPATSSVPVDSGSTVPSSSIQTAPPSASTPPSASSSA